MPRAFSRGRLEEGHKVWVSAGGKTGVGPSAEAGVAPKPGQVSWKDPATGNIGRLPGEGHISLNPLFFPQLGL